MLDACSGSTPCSHASTVKIGESRQQRVAEWKDEAREPANIGLGSA